MLMLFGGIVAFTGDTNKVAAHTKIVRITVDSNGFSPSSFEVEKNHPVTLVFKRTEDVACGKEVRIPSLGIRKALPVGKEVVVKFTPSKTGSIAFTCGMKMMKGSIVVVEPDV